MIYASALDLLPSARQPPSRSAVPLDMTKARAGSRYSAVELSLTSADVIKQGYIAGAGDGIVTVRAIPARRELLIMDANDKDYKFIGRIWSHPSGHYMFNNLDPSKEYLVIARDYKKEFEPFAYDYVKPSIDLTPGEQGVLRESWQQK